jgi:peptidoglycan/xylan/chitin deacetylase (PgdA/CDA1 family)
MSKFSLATIGLVTATPLVGAWASGPLRWWLLGGLGALYLALVGLGVAFIKLNFFTRAICRGHQGFKSVALTFDDGPDPENTPQLLEVLDRCEVKAAFFCIGEKVKQYQETIRHLNAKGHLVGNHTYRHAWRTNFFWGRRLKREIQETQEVIKEVLGTAPLYFRSPMGLTNPHLSGALKGAGLTLIGWDVRGLDYKARSPEPVIQRILRKTRDGSIIVLHDGGAQPAIITAIVSRIIPELRDRGFVFQRLDDLIADARKDAPG